MDRIVTIKNVLLSVGVVACLPLCAMESNAMAIELQKSKNYCWLKNALFAVQVMKKAGMPDAAAVSIVGNSYALRKAEVYDKFDSFFHFDNDNYHVMRNKYRSERNAFIKENPDVLDCLPSHSYLMKEFQKQHSYNIDLCRRCDVIAPHDLFFLTGKQDTVLLVLTSRLKRFLHTQGTMILQFDKKEHEQYVTLPAALLKLLSKYQMNIIDKWAVSSGAPDPEVLSNNYSGSFMNDFYMNDF